MRKIKKIMLIILIILTMMYIPTIALATNTLDDKMMQEAEQYLKNYNFAQITPMAFGQQTEEYNRVWRTEEIHVTRTPGSSGITATVLNSGTHNVDVAIFDSQTRRIIGRTETARAGQLSVFSWTNSQMYDGGKAERVFVLLTMYAEYYNPLTITVTF